nr:immunoglobulin heavy chain junction region [Mus musculus]
CTETLGYW